MKMRFAGDAAFTHEGVILRLRGGKWEARMFATGKDTPKAAPDDLDD